MRKSCHLHDNRDGHLCRSTQSDAGQKSRRYRSRRQNDARRPFAWLLHATLGELVKSVSRPRGGERVRLERGQKRAQRPRHQRRVPVVGNGVRVCSGHCVNRDSGSSDKREHNRRKRVAPFRHVAVMDTMAQCATAVDRSARLGSSRQNCTSGLRWRPPLNGSISQQPSKRTRLCP